MKSKMILIALVATLAVSALSSAALATDWTSWYSGNPALTLGLDFAPAGNLCASYYSGNTTHSYAGWDCARQFSYGHTAFKFTRAAGDTNAYNVAAGLGFYQETDDTFYMAVAGDTFGIGDPSGSTNWPANPADVTVIATNTGGLSSFSGTATVAASTQNFFVIVASDPVGGYNGFDYFYGLNVDFTPVPVPEPSSILALAGGCIGLLGTVIRRRK